jgi:type VI secretion system protein ImpH
MASGSWRPDRALKSLVHEHFGRFNVHQLVRLLLRQQKEPMSDVARRNRSAGRVPVGQRLRFKADISAAFPGREIASVREQQPKAGAPAQVEVVTPNFCIAGAIGPLPEPFTEWLRELRQERSPVMGDFLNIFNQRLNVLRYEFKARQTIALNNAAPGKTAHARYLAALMGMHQHELGDQVPLPRRALLGVAGLLANPRRSAFTVGRVAGAFLGAAVHVKELAGAWQVLEPDNLTLLGRGGQPLGSLSVLGRRVWDQQARIRLVVAPLSWTDFCGLLPLAEGERKPAPGHAALAALLRFTLDRQCDCEVLLTAADPPPPELTAAPAAERETGLRLGQTAWLSARGRAWRAPQPGYQAGFLVRAFELKEAA